MNENNNIVSLETILNKFDENNKKFIKDVDIMEKMSDVKDGRADLSREFEINEKQTMLKKQKLINDIKSGLINDIRNDPSGILVIKRSFFQNLKIKLITFFKKF